MNKYQNDGIAEEPVETHMKDPGLSFRIVAFSGRKEVQEVRPDDRITSYNVCYTKLLRL